MNDFIEPQNFPPDSGGHGGHYPELDADARRRIEDGLGKQQGFFGNLLGIRPVELRRGYARLELDNEPRLCQPVMVMHGGASFGLADTAVAFALMTIYGYGPAFLTIEMKINYLEPIPIGLVTCEAYILRATKRTAYAEADVLAAGKLAARATTTYAIRPRPESGRPNG